MKLITRKTLILTGQVALIIAPFLLCPDLAQASEVGADYVVFKNVRSLQTDAGMVTLGNDPYRINALVQAASNGSITGGTLSLPAGSLATSPQMLVLQNDGVINDGTYAFRDAFADQPSLDNSYANGTYLLHLTGASSASYNASLSVTGGVYPSLTPTFTNMNWIDGTLVVDPSTSFRVTWGAFAGSTASDRVGIGLGRIQDATATFKVLPSTATSYTFPANFFQTNQSYLVTVVFLKVTATNTIDISGSTGFAGYGRSTRVTIQTTAGRGDFNGDGFIDYLLFHSGDRKTAIWYLHGNALQSGSFGPTLPTGWTVACVTDVDLNGKPDYVLFNASSRQTAVWFLDNAAFVSSSFGPTLPAGWTLIAAGDFNHDGNHDYLLFNASTRQTAIWFLNGPAFIGAAYGPTLPAGWVLVDALDFNGDSQPDFLLSNSGTRQSAIWYLNGAAHTTSAFGPTLPSGWTLKGGADFNHDGKPDFVLFEASTQRTALWYLNGAALAGSAYGPTLAAGYSLVFP